MVNNPPSNTTSYLDVGYHMGAGAEYMIHERLSLGADVRHTSGSGDPGLKMKYTSYAGYLGINF
jgi:opacity protein-like surface antigen